ncbi:hypothetical protein CFP59_03287 [Streptomyces malaysiensis subsp. malaysiensis]|nr:hypothetical protein CFP59_03287 [Streptomyces sp. M56]
MLGSPDVGTSPTWGPPRRWRLPVSPVRPVRARARPPKPGPYGACGGPCGGAAYRRFPLPAPSRYQGLRPWTPGPLDLGRSPTTRRSRTSMPQEGAKPRPGIWGGAPSRGPAADPPKARRRVAQELGQTRPRAGQSPTPGSGADPPRAWSGAPSRARHRPTRGCGTKPQSARHRPAQGAGRSPVPGPGTDPPKARGRAPNRSAAQTPPRARRKPAGLGQSPKPGPRPEPRSGARHRPAQSPRQNPKPEPSTAPPGPEAEPQPRGPGADSPRGWGAGPIRGPIRGPGRGPASGAGAEPQLWEGAGRGAARRRRQDPADTPWADHIPPRRQGAPWRDPAPTPGAANTRRRRPVPATPRAHPGVSTWRTGNPGENDHGSVGTSAPTRFSYSRRALRWAGTAGTPRPPVTGEVTGGRDVNDVVELDVVRVEPTG